MLNRHQRAAVHWNAATFGLLRAFDHFLLLYKFHGDISNRSRAIASTNKRTHTQTLSNRHYWKQYRIHTDQSQYLAIYRRGEV